MLWDRVSNCLTRCAPPMLSLVVCVCVRTCVLPSALPSWCLACTLSALNSLHWTDGLEGKCELKAFLALCLADASTRGRTW